MAGTTHRFSPLDGLKLDLLHHHLAHSQRQRLALAPDSLHHAQPKPYGYPSVYTGGRSKISTRV